MSEHKLTLNTGDGQVDIPTKIIKGKLDCIIIHSHEKIEMIVESEIGYPIFHVVEHIGTKYYAPRAVMQGVRRELIVKDMFTKFNLNETLDIIVKGTKSIEVDIIIRFN